jgi:arylsulfatase A-like enzyme
MIFMDKKRPNILLITSDQQHWDTIGASNPALRTPALDRLCQEGTRFNRAYCPNPLCTPSRSSIITGLYPSQHGAWTIGVKLSEDVPTVGEQLQQAGYTTGLVGKAHFQPLGSSPDQTSLECHPTLRDLDFWRKFNGPWYGFEHIEIARNHADEHLVGQHYAIWLEEHGLSNWRDYFRQWPPNPNEPKREHSWDLPEELHYTTWTAERTIAFMEQAVEDDKPFMAWASFHDPHPPYLVPEPWASMYNPDDIQLDEGLIEGELKRLPAHFQLTQEPKPDYSPWNESGYPNHGFHSHLTDRDQARKDIAVYYGMISFMDQQIGRMLDALERMGIADNTIVVFSTDHGHFFGQHSLWAKGPFHYEDLIRLPFIVRWPNEVPAKRQSDALVSLIDLAPSFLSAAGQPMPGSMQGVDQTAVWKGQSESARDHVIVENRHQPSLVHLHTYVGQRYKITVYRAQDYGELFDLQEDPKEQRNLWDDPAYASVKAELLQRFVQAEIAREPTRFPRIAHA